MKVKEISSGRKILLYCPFSKGGLADYAHLQANALVDQGIFVEMLVSPEYPLRSDRRYLLKRELQEPDLSVLKKGVIKSLFYFSLQLVGFYSLQKKIKKEQWSHVLLISYFEYFAPFWVPMLRALSRSGVVFGAMVHEPVRDFIVGPNWWHRYCIRSAYSFIREVFVHEKITLDTGGGTIEARVTIIPQGTFEFVSPQRSAVQVREEWGIPNGGKLLLAFGHLRDNKNLDLLIQALKRFPEIYLLVAGNSQSSRDHDAEHYQKIAVSCGVSKQCRWDIRHIPEGIASDYFGACDLVVLPYRSSFLSASGVLSAAVGFRKPVLVSAGEGCLKEVMRDFAIGYWVEPEDLGALERGIEKWLHEPQEMNWDRYLKENSWEKNAMLVIERLFCPNSNLLSKR